MGENCFFDLENYKQTESGPSESRGVIPVLILI